MTRWLWLILLPCLALAADEQVDTVQGQNAQGCYDTKIRQNTDYNTYGFGGATLLCVDGTTAGETQKAILWFTNVDTIGPGRVIDSVILEGNAESENNATITARQFLKNTVVEDTATGSHTETGAITYAAWSYPGSLWGMVGADSLIAVGTENSDGAAAEYNDFPVTTEGWTNPSNVTVCDVDNLATTAGTGYLLGYVFSHRTGTVVVDSVHINITGYGSVAAGNVRVTFATYEEDWSTFWDWISVDFSTDPATYEVRSTSDAFFGLGTSASFLTLLNYDLLAIAVQREGTAASVYADCISLKPFYHKYSPDYDSTTLATAAVTDVGTVRFNLGSALGQAAYEGTLSAIRVILTGNAATGITTLTSSEGATEANRPRWIIYHSDAGLGPPNYLHGPKGSGVLHGPSGGSVLHGP